MFHLILVNSQQFELIKKASSDLLQLKAEKEVVFGIRKFMLIKDKALKAEFVKSLKEENNLEKHLYNIGFILRSCSYIEHFFRTLFKTLFKVYVFILISS